MSEWNFAPEVIAKAQEIGIGARVVAHWTEFECPDQEGTVVGVEIHRRGKVEYTVHLDGDISPTDGFTHDPTGQKPGTISLRSGGEEKSGVGLLRDKAEALERSLASEGEGVNAYLRDDIEEAISAMRSALTNTDLSLRAENEILRAVVSKCADALGNGAFISPKASVEFMEKLPGEITSVVTKSKTKLEEAAKVLERIGAIQYPPHQTLYALRAMIDHARDQANAFLANLKGAE